MNREHIEKHARAAAEDVVALARSAADRFDSDDMQECVSRVAEAIRAGPWPRRVVKGW